MGERTLNTNRLPWLAAHDTPRVFDVNYESTKINCVALSFTAIIDPAFSRSRDGVHHLSRRRRRRVRLLLRTQHPIVHERGLDDGGARINILLPLHPPAARGLTTRGAMPSSLLVACGADWSFVFSGLLSPHPDRYLTNLEKRHRIFPDVPITKWDGPDGAVRRLDRDGVGGALYLKVEYQTLRRLRVHSEYVLFTVRTHVEPMHAFEEKPQAARNLAVNVCRALQREFRHYKGLGDERIVERTLAYLDACSGGRD